MIQYVPTAPGGWLFVAAPNAVVLVASSDKPDTASHLSDALASPEPIAAVLDLLSSNGLAATPAFAVASWNAEGTVHLIVRGTPTVTLTTAPNATTDEQTIDGSTVSTWRETTITAVTTVRFTVSANSDANAPSSHELPLVAGAVWASSVTISPLNSELPVPLTLPTASSDTPAAPPAESVTPQQQHNTADATVPEHTLVEHTIVEITERELDPASIPTPAAEPAVETTAEPEAEDQPATDGYGHLFGETVVRTIESAAVRPPEDDEEDEPQPATESDRTDSGPTESASTDSDSDSDFDPAIAGPLSTSSPTLTADPASLGDLVAETPGSSAEPVVRNFTGGLRLELSTGGSESLSQPIRVGRAPSVTQLSNGLVPRLITIPDDKDISRNHVDVAVEGDTVVVTDLNSRNGTSVILPGKPPQTLRHGEPTAILVDTVIDLGGGVTLTVKDSQ
ncbi:MAG TPA: FHA domain-containing protein [Glaciihabitans sp.]|jgi:hypothetical protein|nr:FHA domain-containing protein [Glaciihabitans sp.]